MYIYQIRRRLAKCVYSMSNNSNLTVFKLIPLFLKVIHQLLLKMYDI